MKTTETKHNKTVHDAIAQSDKEAEAQEIYEMLCDDEEPEFVTALLRRLKQRSRPEKSNVTDKAEETTDPVNYNFEQVIDWMRKQPIESKLCALLMQVLLRHEDSLPGKDIGNGIYNEFEQGVLEGHSQQDLGFLRGAYLMMSVIDY